MLIDKVAAVAAAGLDSEAWAAQSAAEAASASEDVRYEGPTVLMDKSAAVAAWMDSKARAAESAAEAASASEDERFAEPAVLDDEAGTVAAGLDSETSAAESSAEVASVPEAVRYAGPAVVIDEVAAVSAAGLDSEAWVVDSAAEAALAAGAEPGTDADAQGARSLTARLNESAGAGGVNEVRAPKPSSALRARLSWWPLRAYGAALIFGV